jgi:hypothetical protein
MRVPSTSIPGILNVVTGRPAVPAVLAPDAGTALAAVVLARTFLKRSFGALEQHVRVSADGRNFCGGGRNLADGKQQHHKSYEEEFDGCTHGCGAGLRWGLKFLQAR